MNSPSNLWNSFKKLIYRNYGENPGSMLVHTGAVGWVLSSLAQICAIIFNEKISPEQKMFLIPQELGDAAVNIVSFYSLTSGVKYIGKKLTQTAKIRTPELTEVLKQRGLIADKVSNPRKPGKVYAGDWDFDVTKLSNFKTEISPVYKPFNNGAEVITGLFGSILSSNLVTPVIRNLYASKRQQDMISQYNNWKEKNGQMQSEKSPFDIFTKKFNRPQIHFNNFAVRAYSNPYPKSTGMKV